LSTSLSLSLSLSTSYIKKRLKYLETFSNSSKVIKCKACTGFWWGYLRERDHWGDLGVDGRIILRWIFKMLDVGVWAGLSCFRTDR
jgi:hypothetical protein